MTKDKIAREVYRKLIYFSDNNIKIHFKDFDEIWYNGLIIDLSKEKLTMVLAEDVRGTIPFVLEAVNPDSIVKFEEKVR